MLRNDPRIRRCAAAAFLIAYFVYFSRDTLQVPHPLDAIGNIGYFYRNSGALRLVLSQFVPWGGFFRQMSGLFYLAIFSGFGLNPVPYHVATLLVLLANVYLVYRLARLLGAEELPAGLAALIACYHAGLSNLYYNTAFIPDVLCCFFYLSALVYYLGIRKKGRLPGIGETLAFIGLYVCSMHSKEMAVTLPVTLLAYEAIYHKPEPWSRTGFQAWIRGPARVALLAAVLDIALIGGLAFDPNALAGNPAYHPVFSLQRLKLFQRASLEDLLLGWNSSWQGMLALWILLAYLAWRSHRPVLRFCWIFMVVTPLPIEFLEGSRAACLAIPLAGWAVFLSVIFLDLSVALSGVLAQEPLFRRGGRRGALAAVVAAAIFLWARENSYRKRVYVQPVMAALGRETLPVIEQFRVARPQARPGSRVAFLDDPLKTWDMLYLAELWFRDRSLTIHVQREGPLEPDELARMDYVYTFQQGKLIRLR